MLKLKKKAATLCSREHLAENFATFLPPEIKAWLVRIGRQSKLKYGDVILAIRKCEAELAALDAEANYWNNAR